MFGGSYLERGGSQFQTHQDGSVHQLGDPGLGHLQGVLDQVGDVHLPVWSQHGDDLIGALGGGGVELSQHLDQRALVLQRASATHAPLLVLVVRVAVSGAPWVEKRRING